MKLLFCEACGDIIAPHPNANAPRWCRCGRHAVWWTNPRTGFLKVHDKQGRRDGEFAGYPTVAAAYVIGMTNAFLHYRGTLDAAAFQRIIDSHEDFYLFKQQRSVAIRFRPGESGDTGWAALPET